MDMHSREQYLERVREEYRKAGKKGKTRLLNEARKRTRLNRKVLIGKLAHAPVPKRRKKKRGPRKRTYTPEVLGALVKVWEIFDYPCGQRLAPALRREVERLRKAKELVCSAEVAAKLRHISPRTIDRLLAREKQVRQLRQNRNPSVHPLLYQKIPVKVASEWDTEEVGNLQIDYVAHCGRWPGRPVGRRPGRPIFEYDLGGGNRHCLASTILPGQRQLFFPIDDNYKLGKTALLPYTGADRGRG